MISKWSVSNFKSIRETVVYKNDEKTASELDLGPLTIFCGANSSGKSSLLQSILLISQTMAHKDASYPIILNGSLTNLGQFKELISNHSDSDEIGINFTCDVSNFKNTYISHKEILCKDLKMSKNEYLKLIGISCNISFNAKPVEKSVQIFPKLSCFELLYHLNIEDRDSFYGIKNEDTHDIRDVVLKYSAKADKDGFLKEHGFIKEELMEQNIFKETEDKELFYELNHFLPGKITIVEDDSPDVIRAMVHNILSGDADNIREQGEHYDNALLGDVVDYLKDTVLNEVKGIEGLFDLEADSDSEYYDGGDDTTGPIYSLAEWHKNLQKLSPEKQQEVSRNIFKYKEDLSEIIFDEMNRIYKVNCFFDWEDGRPYASRVPLQPTVFCDILTHISNFFASNVKYLGPLRETPKALYPLSSTSDLFYVGIKGENTASILDWFGEDSIVYIPPDNFKKPGLDLTKTKQDTLKNAAKEWLEYLGVAEDVNAESEGKLGTKLEIKMPQTDYFVDLTNVGVGVSQVLPILVMCLLADENTTFVIEQPELHLHPSIQTKLADFFLSIALCNQQCIIETHSEYIIDKLRLRIAQSPLKDKNHKEEALNNKIKIYFVEKPKGDTEFRSIMINEFAVMSDWPKGFFDETSNLVDEIINASTKKWDDGKGSDND
ncbi:hypothetical protein FACS1894106_4210 [Spirochaetia bacterium]|nr:hypothetical protein FACS1894106_4210 [Spirochaetia bacterium]